MDRRRLVLVGLASVLAAPRAAVAQRRSPPRVALLSGLPSADVRPALEPFRQELQKLGWVDGHTIALLDLRSAEGRNERLPELAAEMLKADPSVVVVFTAPATRVLKEATATVPIVMWGVGDPVEYGLVASVARPGGNVTGTSYLVNEVAAKLVELLGQVAPGATSVAVFSNPGNQGAQPYLRAAHAAGQARGVRVHGVEVRRPEDFDAAFATIERERLAAIIVPPEPLVRSQRARLGEFATQRRLPLLFHGAPAHLAAGGLLTYGAKAAEYPRVVASYVDRILKGAKPADLPIHQPTEFELALSMKIARFLGLTIPQSVLVRASQVVE